MTHQRRKLLDVVVIVLFVAIGALQHVIDPMQMKIMASSRPKAGGETGELMLQLPGQFVVASFAGFKEVIAGALWIRADTFFHEGNFEPIIPIVRLVTWLDPHNIDVYTTGAWHLDYNFVDHVNSLSDKRYIPPAIALLKEGIANNPNIWDLYFELAWTHYNKKLMDYESAAVYMEKACEREGFDPNTGNQTKRPEFVDRMLAHTYEKLGRFDDAIEQWYKARKRVEKMIADKKGVTTYVDRTSLDICDRNLALLYLRLGWRYGDMESYGKGVEIARRLSDRKNPALAKWAVDGAEKDYRRRLAENDPPSDAGKPLDAQFEVMVKRVAPKQLLIKGKLNLIRLSEYEGLASEVFTHRYQDAVAEGKDPYNSWENGSRVQWRLQDFDYKMPDLDTFNWRIDTSQTIAWGDIYVGNGEFSEIIDMSDVQDADMYPFAADKYKLTIWVTPVQPGVPDFVQDRIGWRGEALVDDKYLDTKSQPGFRLLKKEYILSREDIV